jgi:uncharacterized membrane protein (UPF0127 family)
MRKLKTIIICLWIVIGVTSCIHAEVRMIPLYIGSEKFTVEIADTIEKQAIGLMFRKNVPDDFGMLFIYDVEDYHGYWMKNCLVHLDIIYLNKEKQVVDMYINVPPCKEEPCKTYVTRVPAQYVLELRGNRAKEINLKIGDSIFFMLDKP